MRFAIVGVLLLVVSACSFAESTPTPSPAPTRTPLESWQVYWEKFIADAGLTLWLSARRHPRPQRASDADLYVGCDRAILASEVRIGFKFSSVELAREASDTIDDIHISRRGRGEAGRWMKSGWNHGVNENGFLVLRHTPAAAFIDELTQVEELAVLVTHDYGEDTAAVFDVRQLRQALEGVPWDC